jgi:3-phenylpropionate/trans-cinnamate dioxygenase ferredoxin subunit
MSTVSLGELSNFRAGEATTVEREGRTLVVVRLDDEIYILDDRCSHEDFSLAEGEVDEEQRAIECARHGALFSLETGDALTFPATQPVEKYHTRVINGLVEVDLP